MKNTTSSSEGCPAGQPTHAEGQQPVGVLIENSRDQRVLDWLVKEAGAVAIAEAVQRLAGHRRPYVSNIAKSLGLTPPDDLELTPSDEAKRHLSHCRAILRGGK